MGTKSFASFMLNEQLFGIDILLVREVNKNLNLTPVPHAPYHIRGLVNLRGQIVTVLDLKRRLGLEEESLSTEPLNIVLKTDMELSMMRSYNLDDEFVTAPDKVGLLVDAIGDVITVNSNEIELPPANIREIDAKYLSGVVQLENMLMAILCIKKVLEW